MSPNNHHEPFKSLGPLAWEDVERDIDGLPDLLTKTLNDSQILIDSIPIPATITSTTGPGSTGRARAKTDSAVAGYIPPADVPTRFKSSDPAITTQLRKEWKEVKVNPKENPLGLSIYKLNAKDGKGAWFARRSVHYGLSFDKWRLALEREFAETLNRTDKNGSEPGTGNIRGIGAERRVERKIIEGKGALEMFQVSARFPGPTTPRDFITLLMMSPSAAAGGSEERKPRQFILVSRPCTHPDCPPRQGFIRGQYESVEVIREIPIEKSLRRIRSSVDMSRDNVKSLLQKDKTAVRQGVNDSSETIRDGKGEASTTSSTPRPSSPPARPSSAIDTDKTQEREEEEDAEMAIEWLMVTRSDPGGSVPRFMVEKGTPGGIANDANKFIQWLSMTSIEELSADSTAKDIPSSDAKQKPVKEGVDSGTGISTSKTTENQETEETKPRARSSVLAPPTLTTSVSAPQGFYGMISGALGAATSAVANTVAAFTGSVKDTDSEGDFSSSSGEESDSSSEAGYVSAEDWANDDPTPPKAAAAAASNAAGDGPSAHSVHSTTLSSGASSTHDAPSSISTAKRAATISSQHEKELRKLQERRKKAEEKLAHAQERRLTATAASNGNGKDAQAQEAQLAKLREKHEKEMAKQEAKYQRELKKLEEKRRNEEKKAEEKRRKQMEREERANIALELERVKAERDVALKEIEILKSQVGDLQAQNTQLAAFLGKAGLLPGVVDGVGGAGKGAGSSNGLDVKG